MTFTSLLSFRHQRIHPAMQIATGSRAGTRRAVGVRHARHALAAGVALLLLAAGTAQGANTEPIFALTRAAATRGSGGRATLVLEGSFGVADAVQLALPLEVVVTQGNRSARFDLAGNVSISVGGAPAQAGPAPGVLAVTSRTITLVLPAEFAAGDAAAQIVGTYENEPLASNQLQFTL